MRFRICTPRLSNAACDTFGGGKRNAYTGFEGKIKERRSLGRHRRKLTIILKLTLEKCPLYLEVVGLDFFLARISDRCLFLII
jgi:hypothetical protein